MLELDLMQMQGVSGGTVAVGGARSHKETRQFTDGDGNITTEEVDVADSGDGGGGYDPTPEPEPQDPVSIGLLVNKVVTETTVKIVTSVLDAKNNPNSDTQTVVITGKGMTNQEKQQDWLDETKAFAEKNNLDIVSVTINGAETTKKTSTELSGTAGTSGVNLSGKQGTEGQVKWTDPIVVYAPKKGGT